MTSSPGTTRSAGMSLIVSRPFNETLVSTSALALTARVSPLASAAASAARLGPLAATARPRTMRAVPVRLNPILLTIRFSLALQDHNQWVTSYFDIPPELPGQRARSPAPTSEELAGTRSSVILHPFLKLIDEDLYGHCSLACHVSRLVEPCCRGLGR